MTQEEPVQHRQNSGGTQGEHRENTEGTCKLPTQRAVTEILPPNFGGVRQ